MRNADFTILLPMTYVPTPWWRWPSLRKAPKRFLQYLWVEIRERLTTWAAMTSTRLMSTSGWRAKLKLRRAAVVPAAKALYIQMNEAMARGDKDVLNSICTMEMYQTLARTIDARQKGEPVDWELVEYTHRWAGYPKLADDRVVQVPKMNAESEVKEEDVVMTRVRQVVVTIPSIQRISRGRSTAGKTKQVLEHVVLQAKLDSDTWVQSKWKIWGMVPSTTVEAAQEQRDLAKAVKSHQRGS
jgi:mitochondrial protein MBA1